MVHSTNYIIMTLFNKDHRWTSIVTDRYELLMAQRGLVPVRACQFGMDEMVNTAMRATSHTQNMILFMCKATNMCTTSYYYSAHRC